jgi:phosphoribosylformylglycinamidine (FGAM) synthase PurS component
MACDDDLNLPGRPILWFFDPRLNSLILQESQDCRLKLWVQVRFRLLHQKQSKVRIAHLLQFDGDSRDEQKVGVTVPGVSQILWVNTVVSKLEPQISRDIHQSFLGRKT